MGETPLRQPSQPSSPTIDSPKISPRKIENELAVKVIEIENKQGKEHPKAKKSQKSAISDLNTLKDVHAWAYCITEENTIGRARIVAGRLAMGKTGKPFWYAILDRYSRLAFYKRPESGTIAVFAFVTLIPLAVYIIGGYPMLHKERYKGFQKRANDDNDNDTGSLE